MKNSWCVTENFSFLNPVVLCLLDRFLKACFSPQLGLWKKVLSATHVVCVSPSFGAMVAVSAAAVTEATDGLSEFLGVTSSFLVFLALPETSFCFFRIAIRSGELVFTGLSFVVRFPGAIVNKIGLGWVDFPA